MTLTNDSKMSATRLLSFALLLAMMAQQIHSQWGNATCVNKVIQ